MNRDAERRQHPRLDGAGTLFVRITSASGKTIDEGQTVRCSSENVSLDGFRLWLSQPIPEGTLLHLWVRVAGHPGTFLLKGVTKWAKNDGDRGAMVGIQLIDDAADDVGAWQAMVVRKLRGAR